MAQITCEFCSARVREERLPSHLERVHPAERGAIERARRTVRESGHDGAARRPRAPLRVPKRLLTVLAVVVVGGLLLYGASLLPAPPAAFHIHPTLDITVNGTPVTVPSGIGISGAAVASIHTHEVGGVIHVESTEAKTLGDFFDVWGQPFGPDRVLQYVVDDGHALTMTVNGAASAAFDRLVLEEGQAIAITYGPR